MVRRSTLGFAFTTTIILASAAQAQTTWYVDDDGDVAGGYRNASHNDLLLTNEATSSPVRIYMPITKLPPTCHPQVLYAQSKRQLHSFSFSPQHPACNHSPGRTSRSS